MEFVGAIEHCGLFMGHRLGVHPSGSRVLSQAGAPLSDAEQASRLLWSLARTGHTDSELFDTLQPTLAAALPTLPLPCLADLLWAFAKQATVTPLSSSNYRDNASGGSGGGSSIGSVVGSSSRAGRQQRVFSLAQARVIELCSGRGALQPEQQVAHHPSHLSTIAWAYARMGVTPAPLFASLAEAIVRSCTINDKAHAQADGHAPISPHSARQSRQPPADSVTWTAPSVADAAYAFAVAYHRDERLLGVIGQQVCRLFSLAWDSRGASHIIFILFYRIITHFQSVPWVRCKRCLQSDLVFLSSSFSDQLGSGCGKGDAGI